MYERSGVGMSNTTTKIEDLAAHTMTGALAEGGTGPRISVPGSLLRWFRTEPILQQDARGGRRARVVALGSAGCSSLPPFPLRGALPAQTDGWLETRAQRRHVGSGNWLGLVARQGPPS